MDKLILLICLLYQIHAYAESDEMAPREEPNRFEKYKNRNNDPDDFRFVIPPISPELKRKATEKERLITKYYSSIKPGKKLPDDVYECTLKNIRGIGSDVAAAMVWQSCLRLHLD